MKRLFLAACVLLFGQTVFAQDADNLLTSYFSIKNALITADSKASSQAIEAFIEAIKAGKDFTQKNDLLKTADAMGRSTDIEKQRVAFEKVSITMWEIVKQSVPLNQDVYYQYCPMKKAYWLSNEPAIKNPYYGSKMLTCGSVKDKKLNGKE
ncbi:MAG: DUF3347 domain-containing protein [Terrimonas sp.]|nr:DUF3347 domain-containing protein [Terrimonas sp.]